MIRKIYLFLVLFILGFSSSLLAQIGTGELRGKVIDNNTNEGVPFAAVIVELNGSQVAAQQSDFEGNYSIKPISPGKYDVRIKIIGYNERVINGVTISANKQTYLDPKVTPNAVQTKTVEVTSYKVPLIEKDNTAVGGTITSEQIKQLPTRNINSLVSTTAGIYQADQGGSLSVRGSRSDANDYYIDGVKVRGANNLPQSGIEQVSVITGGVPAQYGDATGGIISITTKGPSRKFTGGAELATSEFLDGYGYNLGALNVSGPILMKDKGTENARPLVGYFASVEFESQRDQNPSAVGAYRAKSDWLDYIRYNPLDRPNLGDPTFTNINAEYTRGDKIEKVKAQDDNEKRNLSYTVRLDYQPTLNNTFAFGFSGTNEKSRIYRQGNMLFNSENNDEFIRNSYRVFGRYTQKFNSANQEGSSSIIKNAYYSIQVDYSKDYNVQQNPIHKDNYFAYGYLGKFDVLKQNLIVPVQSDSIDAGGNPYIVLSSGDTIRHIMTGDYGTQDTAVLFTPGSENPYLAAYNSQYYNFVGDDIPNSYVDILSGRGALNGAGFVNTFVSGLSGFTNAYGGLWNLSGRIQDLYRILDRDQYRISATAAADIKNHSLQFGLEYEQRVEREFRINPIALWSLARVLANGHNRLVTTDSSWVAGDTLLFERDGNLANASTFSKNLRNKLGINGSDYVNVDAYDPSTYSLDMFSPDELGPFLNNGLASYVYSGYTYDGKRSKSNVSFYDYFTDTLNRPVGAFRPIYIAGYIQDKFTFKDIIFNLGVRVDRFDANQQVLKDKYSLYGTRKASSVPNKPSNIGDDFVVYVNDPQANDVVSAGVKGYRDGDVFYDAQGNVVSNPDVIANNKGQVTPWLADGQLGNDGNPRVNASGFKDYEPQVQVMPRIAFSFPVSDEANFFANYDVLTQRPRNFVFSNPTIYALYQAGGSNLNIISPDLRPEKSINYQFGFKQRVSQTSALTLTAFYRELKDNFQETRINFAYPFTYSSYTNRDFGTIKGFTASYDLRRTNNISASVAYTLQFANGTGSSATSANNLIDVSQSNLLRIPLPFDYDQRHTIVATVDYRYGAGADYNGPASLKGLLEELGANLIFRAGSGTPYSRISADVVQDFVRSGDTRFRRLVGEINGSRLPWEFNLDLRLDKNIKLTTSDNEGNARASYLNVYLLIQNVLDTKRVAAVYPATGSPDDDGYLASNQAQAAIAVKTDPQAYVDMYNIRINDPANFRLPRVIRLGAIYNF